MTGEFLGLTYVEFEYLIHSAAPQSRPVVIIVFTHVVRPYLRPHFSKSNKTKQISSENNVTAGKMVCLTEWIIDDACLVILLFLHLFPQKSLLILGKQHGQWVKKKKKDLYTMLW